MRPDLKIMRTAMHPLMCQARLLCLAVICAGLGASLVTAVQARDAAAPYLGMTQDQVIACAGEPHSRYRSGANAETLTYRYSGAGPVPAEPDKAEKKKKKSIADVFGDKKKKNKNWTCSASLVFEGGKLASVTFAHKDVESPYAWQSEKDPKKREAMRKKEVPTCTFSLPRCTR